MRQIRGKLRKKNSFVKKWSKPLGKCRNPGIQIKNKKLVSKLAEQEIHYLREKLAPRVQPVL